MSKQSSDCENWSAIHDFMPPRPARLKVSGECTMPTPGYTIVLIKKIPQGINPKILILEKTVTPPTTVEPQHLVVARATFEETTDYRYTEVTIVPDEVTIKVEEVH